MRKGQLKSKKGKFKRVFPFLLGINEDAANKLIIHRIICGE